MYQTLVRPVVTYGCETCVLKENIKTKSRLFERKALRRIYGPTNVSDGTKSNEELNRLIGNKNIINYIKAQRLAWFGHVHRMPDNSMVNRVYEWSPALTRSLGKPKSRWEDDVNSDITNMKITNWRDCIRNRPKWKEFVEKAKTSLQLCLKKKKKKKKNSICRAFLLFHKLQDFKFLKTVLSYCHWISILGSQSHIRLCLMLTNSLQPWDCCHD